MNRLRDMMIEICLDYTPSAPDWVHMFSGLAYAVMEFNAERS